MTVDLSVLEPFLGEWKTREPGAGRCPRGRVVRFHEVFSLRRVHPGDVWIQLDQRAWDADTDATVHIESGVIRAGAAGLELSLVMSSGRMELGRGGVEDGVLTLESREFLNDRKQVLGFRRILSLREGALQKKLALATGLGWPELTPHMASVLYRASVSADQPPGN